MRRVVVTGTDTGVGKTFVASAIARELADRGRSVVALKPVETGVAGPPSEAEDGWLLAAATGQAVPRHALHRFSRPLTPALAAELEGRTLELAPLAVEIEELVKGAELALIEGAGGLLSPVAWGWTFTDLARILAADALVVAPDRLGSINHVLLTLGELARARVQIRGIVLSAPAAPDDSTGLNRDVIARMAPGIPVIAIARIAGGVPVPGIDTILSWLDR